MITFDRQARPLHNLNRSQVMGRSVSFSDPARPPVGGVGRPKHPPPNFVHAFQNLPPPQFLFGVLRPQVDVFANKINFSF